MGAFTPDRLVHGAARVWTPEELCGMWDFAVSRGDPASLYLDALAVHARRTSWGDLIEQSMNGWKEVDVGVVVQG